LQTLESFNPFNYQLITSHLRDIVDKVVALSTLMPAEEKKKLWTEVKHHRNALGMLLDKKSKYDNCAFFKPNEKMRKKYLSEIRSATTVPHQAVEIVARSSYVKL
jgi:hypothetical protein